MLVALASACATVPDGLTVVDGFDADRYLGRWYEVARLDHRFERNLTSVTADYRRAPDGSIEITNRGYDSGNGQWRVAQGRGQAAGPANEGRFKVSFFGPIQSGYNILALDKEHYSWALVCGNTRSYLWILARRPHLEPVVRERLVAQAAAAGFDTDALLWVDHSVLYQGTAP